MPPVPSTSPATGQPVPPDYLHTCSTFFQDTWGRSVLLRGVNLSGSSKAPRNQPSYSLDDFWESGEEGRGDFVGRPLNLDDGSADVHLARLRAWGFNMLRYVFTWEALEHEGPGKYDMEYVAYVVKVLRKCKEWGFRVFMDPHQDVWSRFSGGSGAPLWTLYACGIDPRHQSVTGATLLHNEWPSASAPKPSSFPGMVWGTNYTHLTSQTIFTLFFAGKTFAPKCVIDGVNIQDYLQKHFIDAVVVLARAIADAGDLNDSCVLGWDSINEPGEGLVGKGDLAVIPKDQQLKKGPSPTPFEGMRLGMGEAQEVVEWGFGPMGPYQAGKTIIDPQGARLWLKAEDEATRGGGKWGWTRGAEWELGTCIWAQHGVWDTTTKTLLKPYYFDAFPSDSLRIPVFDEDFFKPHAIAYGEAIRTVHPEAVLFIQAPVFHRPPNLPQSLLRGRACNSPHYYDGLTLMTKHWNWFNADALGMIRKKYWSIIQAIRVGETAIRKSIQDQLGMFKDDTREVLGQYPTLVGEIGVPYDMDDKKSYGYTEGGKYEGDYSPQQRALDCSLNATDGPNCLNYTIWTYCPDNSHQWGDLWNGEDLSLWSADDIRPMIAQRYSDDVKNISTTTISVAPTAIGAPTTSSISLAVPSSASTLVNPPMLSFPDLSPALIARGEFPFALIHDGARAVGAFSRPFPVQTVGEPVRIDFDISTSKFTLRVKVSPSDFPTSPDDDADGLVTEVFLPYVHYAASLQDGSVSLTSDEKPISPSASTTSLLHDQHKAQLAFGVEGNRLSPQVASPTPVRLQASGKAAGVSSTPSPASSVMLSGESSDLTLSISVNASHGTTSTVGQTLFWKYDKPTSASEVYTLEVSRVGGVLMKAFGGEVEEKSWKDVCACPQSCVIC